MELAACAKKEKTTLQDAINDELREGVKTRRIENSLYNATKKFMLLKGLTINMVVNLNDAAEMLGVPKRKLYDITSVMAGINYIYKTSTNQFRWTEEANPKEIKARKRENDILKRREAFLDGVIKDIQSLTRLLLIDPINNGYLYTKPDDFKDNKANLNEKLIAIKARDRNPKNIQMIPKLQICTK
ncbi:unnamed protein product [Caenorhabditis bovis]|uniref:E2F/DP family winged-helix DNA-binding domain-containing protein n=1 Tax=Caenorhabditis bovis TaxID=2654633 RepID=A0A8S1F0A1_9PELO|nr:unnamed protein product [Caenorhabditis bovis]